MDVQGVLAFVLTAFTGPGLISPDIANGALPLYFCRPFSRAEYVLGKTSVLAILLSQITWIPGPGSFRRPSEPGRSGLDLGSSLDRRQPHPFFTDLDLDSVASRHGPLGLGKVENRRWRTAACGLVLRSRLRTSHQCRDAHASRAASLDIAYLMATVWASLFRLDTDRSITSGEAWIALLTYCGICLALLVRKVRAYEVIR